MIALTTTTQVQSHRIFGERGRNKGQIEVNRTVLQVMAPPNYIDRHGNVGGSKTIFRQITDLFFGIINFVALFFTAVSNPPQRISESRSTVSPV